MVHKKGKGMDMKKIVMSMIVSSLVVAAYGNIQVAWDAAGGFYWDANGTSTYTPGNTFLTAGGTTTAQLMFSPDATRDSIGLNGLGSVNDTLLASFSVSAPDGYAYFDAGLATATYTAGYAYALIFQKSAHTAGDWYYYTPMITLADITGSALPQTIEMNTDLANGNAVGKNGLGVDSAQVVPEPATFLLFGIGGMGAWLIRRNKMQVKEEAEG